MNLDFILILIFGAFLGAIIGLLFAKLSEKIKKKTNINLAKQVIAGKKKNSVKIDGEEIDIRKFKWKTPEGKIEAYEFNPLNVEMPKKEGKIKENKQTVSNY